MRHVNAKIQQASRCGRNVLKTLLREIADDDKAPMIRRIHAVDRLASLDNIYQSQRFHTTENVGSGTRPRRQVIRLLLKMQRTAEVSELHQQMIRTRLVFIQTGEALCRGRHPLWRNEPSTPSERQKSSVASEIDEVLAAYEKQKRGSDANSISS
jgi:hypothetical protein